MQLADARGFALLMVARDAFVHALHTAAAIAADAAIGVALFDMILLRHVSAISAPTHDWADWVGSASR